MQIKPKLFKSGNSNSNHVKIHTVRSYPSFWPYNFKNKINAIKSRATFDPILLSIWVINHRGKAKIHTCILNFLSLQRYNRTWLTKYSNHSAYKESMIITLMLSSFYHTIYPLSTTELITSSVVNQRMAFMIEP